MDIALNLRKTSIISSDVSQGWGGGLKRNVAMTFLVEKSICDVPLNRAQNLIITRASLSQVCCFD